MTDLKRKTKFTWDYTKNKVDSSPITAVQGEANSHVFEVSLIGDFEPVSDLKLTMYYKSKLSDNAGMVQFDFDEESGLFVVNVPAEMMQSSSIDLCFTLEYEKEEEMLSSLIFTMNLQKSLLKNVQNLVDNNLTDFQKLFLATLPADVVDRITALQTLIDKKADKTSLDATNTEVAKKATITSVNQKLPIVTSDASSTGLAYTITSTNFPSTIPDGFSFKFKPSITSTATSATLAINGGTAFPFSKIDSYTGGKVTSTSGFTNITSPGFLQSAYHTYTLTMAGGTWVITEEPAVNPLSLTTVVPVSKGGSGVSTLTGLVKGNGTDPMTSAVMGTDYAQPHGVGSVVMNSSGTDKPYMTGTWSNIGNATIGSTTVYYWKRTA